MSESIKHLIKIVREFNTMYEEKKKELMSVNEARYDAYMDVFKAYYEKIKKAENKEKPTLRFLECILVHADILNEILTESSELDELYGMCNRLLKSDTSSPISASAVQDVLNIVERFLESEGFVSE